MNNLLVLIASIVFILYPLWIYYQFGVKFSISETWYTLEKNDRNSGFIFVAWLWLWIVLLMFSGITQKSELLLVALIIEAFIGSAPAFKRIKQENLVHMIASIGGIAVGIIAIAITVSWVWAVCLLATFLIIRILNSKTYIWWIEIVAFYGIVWTFWAY